MPANKVEKYISPIVIAIVVGLIGWGGVSLSGLQQSYAGMTADVNHIKESVSVLRKQQSNDIRDMRRRIGMIEAEAYAKKR